MKGEISDNKNISFKQCDKKDYDLLQEMEGELIDDENKFTPKKLLEYRNFKNRDNRPSKSDIENDIKNSKFILYDNKICGFFRLDLDLKSKPKQAELNFLYIKKGFRGEGIGNFTISSIINYCKELNIKLITLGVSSKNENAFNLYKKHGFNEYHKSMFIKI